MTNAKRDVTVVLSRGNVCDAQVLTEDVAAYRTFVRLLPGRNTCWVPGERVVDRME